MSSWSPKHDSTYLVIDLRRNSAAGLQTGGDVEDLGDGLSVAVDAERKEGSSKPRAVAEKANSLALESLAIDKADQTSQTTPDTAAVHVTAHSSNLNGGGNTLLEALLGEGHEGLLDNLVGQRLLVIHVTELRGHLGKGRGVSVGEVVMVEESGIRLLDKLAGRSVESKVVEAVKVGLVGIAVSDTVGAVSAVGGLLGLTLAVLAVGRVKSLGVAVDRVVTIDVGVFAGQVGLVEVIGVLHVGAAQARLDNDGSIGADEQSDSTSATSRTSVALGVESNVTSNNNTITAVPGRGLDPVDSVENGVGATVAGVDSVDTLDVGVVAKKLHKDGLDRLGLVEQSLGTDLKTANGVGVDVVVLEELGSDGKGERVDVCQAQTPC